MTREEAAKRLQLGFAALARNDLLQAAEQSRLVLVAHPKLPQAHFLVGLIASASNDKRMAISAFGSVTKLEPGHAAAWAQLARLFCSLGQMNRADRALSEALKNDNGDPLISDSIGAVLSLLGEHADAGGWYRKAVQAKPEHVPFLVNLANNQIYTGELDEASETLAAVFRLTPENANAHWMLSGIARAKDRVHIDALYALATKVAGQLQSEAFVYYALGKELEDLEQWDEAFDAFARGATARRTTLNFDEALEAGFFSALEKDLTSEWLVTRPAGHDDASPIFVVGQPRTGTTLVERMIVSDPSVHSAGELQQFGYSIRRLTNYSGMTRYSDQLVEGALDVDVKSLGETYLQATTKARGALPRFVDKLPGNYLYLPFVFAALPNARVVHLTRDPMDACFASFKQLFADAYPHSYDQQEMARHHARYWRLMEVWRDRFSDRFHSISYEATTAEPETEARRLFDYLGLSYHPGVLDFHKRKDAVATASAVQVREPVHARSVGRWRRYEKRLDAMQQTLRDHGVPVG